MKYFEGDIVELMHFDVDRGSEGYVRNRWGFIPKVGDRFSVKYDFDSENTSDRLVTVNTGFDKQSYLEPSQIFLYKRPGKF